MQQPERDASEVDVLDRLEAGVRKAVLELLVDLLDGGGAAAADEPSFIAVALLTLPM